MSLTVRWIGALVALVLAIPLAVAAEGEDDAQPRVVVAAIDTAINPYHEFFHAGGDGPYADSAPSAVTEDVLDEFGIGEDQIISLTRTGNQFADVAADAEQWDAVERGVPYWFEGTNVIGISFRGSPHLQPTPDKSAHGMGVTASVLEANPEAVVVLVESPVSIPPIESAAQLEAEEWAFTHSAVDIVSTSYGWPGSPPVPDHLSSSYTGVVENGKYHFAAVDNTPALSPIDTTGGPWWSIGIAGYQEETTNGRTVSSGSVPDFVGNFTQSLPYTMVAQEGRSTVSGTSFATPHSAGTMSAILLEARRAAGHLGGIVTDDVDLPLMVDSADLQLTNWDLRRALEEAAYYPTFDEFSGTPGTSVPVPDQAPYTLTGWGAITPDPERGVIDETLAHAGAAGEPTRFKDSETCAYMTAVIEARWTYWTFYAFGGEGWLEFGFPYEYCDL